MLLDGTRDHGALRKELFKLFESGALTLLDADKPVSDMQIVEKRIAAETENVLGGLARTAVLMK
jgi:hypothetical protein